MFGWIIWDTDLVSYVYFVVVDAHSLTEESPNDSLSILSEDHVLFKVIGYVKVQKFIWSHLLKSWSYYKNLRPPLSNVEAGESSETTCESF